MGTVIRATAAYWFLLFTIRVIGRRAVNQMTPFELILLFLLGGISIQAIVNDDRSLTNAFIAVITVGMNHVLVAWLKQKSVRFRKVADGTPVIIIENGQWHRELMWNMRLQDQDIMAVARQQGMRQLHEIETAIVERNGSISVYKRSEDSKQQGESSDGSESDSEAPQDVTPASPGQPSRSSKT